MAEIDTDAAGILIGNGCDVATAIAASVRDEPQPVTYRTSWLTVGALVGGMVLFLLLLLL
jgi:hypothetical protein